MDVKLTCPLGSECEKAVDGHIERCAWYTKVVGMNPQTGAELDDWRCAIAWQPILILESSRQTQVVAASVLSMRNNVDKRQKEALEVVKNVQIPANS